MKKMFVFFLLVSVFVTAQAATTRTTEVLVNFDGTLSGTTYTLAAGEVDTTGTFTAQGTTLVVADGVATLNPGDNAEGLTDGFNFDGAGIVGTNSFIMEVMLSRDETQGTFANLLDICGNMFARFYNGTPQFGYWDGSSEPMGSFTALTVGQMYHAALVWDESSNTLEFFLDGVSQGTVSGGELDQAGTLVSFGNFNHSGAGTGRGLNGTLDSVAFSTYTGTFDVNTDFILPDKAHTPSPENGATAIAVKTDGDTGTPELTLSWQAPRGYTPTEYRVYFGTTEPNSLLANYGLTELTAASHPYTAQSIDPSPAGDLAYMTDYYWVVDAYEPNATGDILHPGDAWMFTTKAEDNPPSVDAGEGLLVSLEMVTAPNGVPLLGSVTDDGTSALTIGWEAFEANLGGGATTKVTFADATDPNTTITVSEAGTYIVKLTATDATGSVSDQKEIRVYADACDAAKATGTWQANYYDRNGDCVVNLDDFVVFALEWLNSTALSESFLFTSDVPDDFENALFAEYWAGIEGNDVNDLLNDADYPAMADGSYLVTGELRGGVTGETYGQRIRGYIVPPATGVYTFHIASDDDSRLFLSADTTPVDTDPVLANQIAQVAGAVSVDQWDAQSGQSSAPMSLTVGQYYYIEVLHKEGVGGDHLSVGWKKPGETTIEVIPASALRYTLP